jgi:hypothetical protein
VLEGAVRCGKMKMRKMPLLRAYASEVRAASSLGSFDMNKISDTKSVLRKRLLDFYVTSLYILFHYFIKLQV